LLKIKKPAGEESARGLIAAAEAVKNDVKSDSRFFKPFRIFLEKGPGKHIPDNQAACPVFDLICLSFIYRPDFVPNEEIEVGPGELEGFPEMGSPNRGERVKLLDIAEKYVYGAK
jgi:hypothetical protein